VKSSSSVVQDKALEARRGTHSTSWSSRNKRRKTWKIYRKSGSFRSCRARITSLAWRLTKISTSSSIRLSFYETQHTCASWVATSAESSNAWTWWWGRAPTLKNSASSDPSIVSCRTSTFSLGSSRMQF